MLFSCTVFLLVSLSFRPQYNIEIQMKHPGETPIQFGKNEISVQLNQYI